MLLNQRLFSVFPTDVGVIPTRQDRQVVDFGIPHGCGGDPSWSRI